MDWKPLAHVVALAVTVGLAACEAESAVPKTSEADRGAKLIATTGCGMCHQIPGIAGADGEIGPPLDHIASRVYIAGMLRNSPENLSAWIQHPQTYVPGNAMPEMGVSADDARSIAAYLDTLR